MRIEMKLPQLPLGVAVMDADHYALEQMFARTSQIEDAGLPAHIDAIIAEIRAHFLREEAEMEKVGVPILHCHKGQHAALLQEAEKLRESFSRADARMQRHLIGFALAQHLANHIASVDQISSTFFDEKIDYAGKDDAPAAGCCGG
jgi:hemerythrin-like metal-binding protein